MICIYFSFLFLKCNSFFSSRSCWLRYRASMCLTAIGATTSALGAPGNGAALAPSMRNAEFRHGRSLGTHHLPQRGTSSRRHALAQGRAALCTSGTRSSCLHRGTRTRWCFPAPPYRSSGAGTGGNLRVRCTTQNDLHHRECNPRSSTFSHHRVLGRIRISPLPLSSIPRSHTSARHHERHRTLSSLPRFWCSLTLGIVSLLHEPCRMLSDSQNLCCNLCPPP